MTEPAVTTPVEHMLLEQLCEVLERAQQATPTPERAAVVQHLRRVLEHAEGGLPVLYDTKTISPDLAAVLADLKSMGAGSLGTATASLVRLQAGPGTISDILVDSASDQRRVRKQAWLAEAERLSHDLSRAEAARSRIDAIADEWTAIKDLDGPDDLWDRFEALRAASGIGSTRAASPPDGPVRRAADNYFARNLLRENGRRRQFRTGDLLIVAGEVSDYVLMIEKGHAKVVLPGRHGVDVIREFCGPGTLLGEMGVIEGRPRSANVVARTAGAAMFVDAETFRDLMETVPKLRDFVFRLLRQRLHSADQRQLLQATHDVADRVARILLDFAYQFGDPTEGGGLLIRGITQAEIAQFAIASPKSVEWAVSQLRKDGLLQTARRTFALPDPQLLERCLANPDWRVGQGPSTGMS